MRPTTRPAPETIEPDYHAARRGPRDQPTRDVLAAVLREAIKNLTAPSGQGPHNKRRRQANSCVFLASTRATEFFDHLELSQDRCLRAMGFAEKAHHVLASPASDHMTPEERQMVESVIQYLRRTGP